MDDIQVGRRIRLNGLLNALNIKSITFAKTLKTNPGFISQLLNGHRKLTTEFAYRISECYPKVSAEWLISGRGEMFLEKKEAEPGLLTGVMEPDARYDVVKRIALDDLAGIIERLQGEVGDLRERVRRLEEEIDNLKHE